MPWLDDYFDWISTDGCCRIYRGNHTFCPTSGIAHSVVVSYDNGCDEFAKKKIFITI